MITKQKQRYEDFKQEIEKRYDWISVREIAKINKSYGRIVTFRECVAIYKELFEEA